MEGTQLGYARKILAATQSILCAESSPGNRAIIASSKSILPTVAGGSYHLFAGRECARALAILSLKEEDCNGNLSDLTEEQVKKLDEWVAKFEAKYPVVGRLV